MQPVSSQNARHAEEHLHLVTKVAKRIARRLPQMVDLGDLVGAGTVGLLDALSKYDPSRATFAAYAEIRIRGAILDYLREIDWLPRAQRARARAGERVGVVGIDDVTAEGFESLAGTDIAPSGCFAKKEGVRFLRVALQHLNERQRQVLSLYYVEELTMKEIGSMLGVTESRVCQIHGAAIAELRRILGDDVEIVQ